jgi:RNA polymerase sigma-70 factor (ECF subfamily)
LSPESTGPSEGDVKWSAQSDASLALQAAAGLERAFEHLLQRHRQRVLRICLRMLNDQIDAEEAAQDIFVKIFRHLKDYDQRRDFTVWSTTIAMNECRDRLRKRQRKLRLFRNLDEIDRETAFEAERSNCVESKNRLSMVEKALAELPENLKEVIVLKAYGQHSYEEIAKILKVRVGTVMSRLHRARRRLTKILEKGGQR